MTNRRVFCSGVSLLQCHAVLRLSCHRSASEVNRSGADAQVIPCHSYPVIFHPIIDQLTVFYISGLILLSSKSSVAILMSPRAAHAREVRKLCIDLGLTLKHSAIIPQEINYPVTGLGNVANVECMHGILVMR